MTLKLIGNFFICLKLLQPLVIADHQVKVYSLVSNHVQIALPVSLRKVSDFEIAQQFPIVSQRPSYIFEDKTNEIKLAINYGASNAVDSQLRQIKKYFEKFYKSSVSDFLSSNLIMINRKLFVLMKFEILEGTINEKRFNYLFLTTINGKLFMANYSFPNEKIYKEEKVAETVLHSIKIKD